MNNGLALTTEETDGPLTFEDLQFTTIREELLPPAHKLHEFRPKTFDTLRLEVSPSDPLQLFPPVLFSRAVTLAESIMEDYAEMVKGDKLGPLKDAYPTLNALENETFDPYLVIVGLMLHFNRESRGGVRSDEISFARTSDDQHILQISESTFLSHANRGNGSNGNSQSEPYRSFFLGSPDNIETLAQNKSIIHKNQPRMYSTIRNMIEESYQRGVVMGKPALIFPEYKEGKELIYREIAAKIMLRLANSPYNSQSVIEHPKSRYLLSVIETVTRSAEDDYLRRAKNFFSRSPQHIIWRGWCGGISLHPAAEFGGKEYVRWAINHWESLDRVGHFEPSVAELVNARDYDGSTPFHLARRFGHADIAEILLDAGADPNAVNRYGQKP